MPVLPTPGGDDNIWGTELNTWLQVAHNSDGSLQTSAVTAAGAVNAIVAGSNVSVDASNPARPIVSLSGSCAPGYQQVDISYNGNGPFVADCLVGEGFDPAVGGFITGQFPIEAYFGSQPPGTPQTFTGTAYIDGSGVVDTFMLLQAGMGGTVATYDNLGQPVSTAIQNAYLYGPGGGYVASVAAGTNVSVDATDPLNPIVSSSSPGYRQLTLTYNGSDPFQIDCLVGEGYDPTVGGEVFGMFPVAMLFGGTGPILPCSAYIDGSGVVQGFMYLYWGEGAGIWAYGSAGNADTIVIQNASLDNSAIVSGDEFVLQVPSTPVHIYTSTDPSTLTAGEANAAFGFTARPTSHGGTPTSHGSLYTWDSTFSQWGPIAQPIGNVTLQAYARNGPLLGQLDLCPWYPQQPDYLVSTAGPSGSDSYPFLTMAAGDTIAVQVNHTLQQIGRAHV